VEARLNGCANALEHALHRAAEPGRATRPPPRPPRGAAERHAFLICALTRACAFAACGGLALVAASGASSARGAPNAPLATDVGIRSPFNLMRRHLLSGVVSKGQLEVCGGESADGSDACVPVRVRRRRVGCLDAGDAVGSERHGERRRLVVLKCWSNHLTSSATKSGQSVGLGAPAAT
jgi:hypothetical protein